MILAPRSPSPGGRLVTQELSGRRDRARSAIRPGSSRRARSGSGGWPRRPRRPRGPQGRAGPDAKPRVFEVGERASDPTGTEKSRGCDRLSVSWLRGRYQMTTLGCPSTSAPKNRVLTVPVESERDGSELLLTIARLGTHRDERLDLAGGDQDADEVGPVRGAVALAAAGGFASGSRSGRTCRP